MKNLFLIYFASVAACLSPADSRALDISVGSTSVQPGSNHWAVESDPVAFLPEKYL